jgi:TolA-binding protein
MQRKVGHWLAATLGLARVVATSHDALAEPEDPPSSAVDCQAPAPAPRPIAPLPRDPRRTRIQQRPIQVVLAETEGLERLLAQAPPDSRDRPEILRRIAEDDVELENIAVRQHTPALIQPSREKAIRAYTTLKDDHPDYPALDEVLYDLAFEHEQAGNLDSARKTYFTLIQSRPGSKYVPLAYLSFAEMFYAEGAQDPSKWAIAQQAYEKVVSYPPPDNHAYGYAWFKLAHVYWREGQGAKAKAAFQKAKSWGQSFPQDPAALSVSQAAEGDRASLQAVCPP